MNEIVKYDTYLNKLDYSSLNTREQNVFMSILAKIKNKELEEITLSYDELIDLANLKDNKLESSRKYLIIESTKDKLFNISCDVSVESEHGTHSMSFHVFDKWENNEIAKMLTLSISPTFVKFVNNPQKFLSFPLHDFVMLESNYSKTLYRILKQFDSIGTYKFHSVEQFRELMHIPDTMPNKKIKVLLNQVVSEISNKGYIKNLTYSIEKDLKKKGHPIKTITLKWDL